jgi:hypothetical protein
MCSEVLAARDGWTLDAAWEGAFPYGAAGYLSSPVRCTLSGLRATPVQARAITMGRAVFTVEHPFGNLFLLHLEVTQAEASAIASGRHPLDVLMPPLYARSLTLEEMMGA